MTADLPAWIPADPGASPALPESEGRGGLVVVLLVTEAALSGGWAGAVAVDLLGRWSDGGRRVVAADAGLSTPLLHEALGIANHEGLVDALRWGTSVQRVIQRPVGHRFLALTAGTAVADTAATMALPRWPALCDGFRQADVTLAVLVPEGEGGLSAVLGQADALLVLAGPREDVGELVAGVTAPVLAVLGRRAPSSAPDPVAERPPAPSESAPPEEPDEDVPPEDVAHEQEPPGQDVMDQSPDPAPDAEGDEAPDSPMRAPEAEVPETLSDPPPDPLPDPMETTWAPAPAEADGVSSWGSLADDGAPAFDEGPLPVFRVQELLGDADHDEVDDEDFVLPDPIPVPPSLEEIVEESEARLPRSRVGLVIFLILLAVVAVVTAAAWMGYVDIPGITPRTGAASSAPPTPVTAAAVVETAPAQSYSLALGSFQDPIVAARLVTDLGLQAPEVLFQSVPVDVDGTVYYRVFAGPASDSVGAMALTSRIADSASLDPASWVARWTPVAFRLGEVPDRQVAERRVGALSDLGVAAYVLAVDYSDGSAGYRIYTGAFADAGEASFLSELLDERGLSSAQLSDRTGRLPE